MELEVKKTPTNGEKEGKTKVPSCPDEKMASLQLSYIQESQIQETGKMPFPASNLQLQQTLSNQVHTMKYKMPKENCALKI